MLNIISKVCSIPKDFYSIKTKNIFQIFNETGYLEAPETITRDNLIDYLKKNPSLINYWEMYSSDKRYSPSWYFVKRNSEWIVGYSSTPSQEQKNVFSSEYEACAEFILHELKEFSHTTHN